MCWFHVEKNYETQLNLIDDANDRIRIDRDIKMLQASSSPEIFHSVFALFEVRWSKYKEFVNYFKAEWYNTQPNWYEGYAPGLPSTNNALEATNRVIKDENTFGERLQFSRFLVCALELAENWSRRRAANSVDPRPFMHDTRMTPKVWKQMADYSLSNFKTKEQVVGMEAHVGIRRFYCLSSKCRSQEPIEQLIEKHRKFAKSKKWSSLQEYKLYSYNCIYDVKIVPHSWKQSTCTCVSFMKFYLCKHIVGICERLHMNVIPRKMRHFKAKAKKIERKKKRGRLSKAKKALEVHSTSEDEEAPRSDDAPCTSKQASARDASKQTKSRQRIVAEEESEEESEEEANEDSVENAPCTSKQPPIRDANRKRQEKVVETRQSKRLRTK
jgi:hypothetical protein